MKGNFKKYIEPDITNAKILVDAAINNLAHMLETEEVEEVTFPNFLDRGYLVNILESRGWKYSFNICEFEDREYYFDENTLVKYT